MISQKVPAQSWLDGATSRARPVKSRMRTSLQSEHIKCYVTEARNKAAGAVTHGRSNVRCVIGAWNSSQSCMSWISQAMSCPPDLRDNLDFDWRDLLASMDPPVVRGLLEESEVRAFSFRLLQGTLDHNWRKRDAGERHVFDMTLADGTTVHLHFHKNGRFDVPTVCRNGAGTRGPAASRARSDTTLGSEELSSWRALRTDSMLEDDRAGAVKQRPAALGMAVPGS